MQCRDRQEHVGEQEQAVDPAADAVCARVEPDRLVGGEERPDAGADEAERRRAPRRRDEEAGQAREQQDVHGRIESVDDLLARVPGRPDRGAHHERPLEDGERERDDAGVGERRRLVPAARREHQQQQARGGERVGGEEPAVGPGRLRRVRLDEREHVAGDRADERRREQVPGQAQLRPVEPDPVEDGERCRAVDHDEDRVLHVPAGRERVVEGDQRQPGAEVHVPRLEVAERHSLQRTVVS